MIDRISAQGIGLRPQPWARLSRRVGPVGRTGSGFATTGLLDAYYSRCFFAKAIMPFLYKVKASSFLPASTSSTEGSM